MADPWVAGIGLAMEGRCGHVVRRMKHERWREKAGSWRSAWCRLAMIVAILCSPSFAEELNYPRIATESILSAHPNKWKEVELVRDYEVDQVVSYRFMIHNGRRDRRGPGVYRVSSQCILFARKAECSVIKETADEFELLIKFEGYDKKSSIRISSKRRSAGMADAWVAIEGNGEIYDEFAAKLAKVRKEADEFIEEEDWGKQLPKGPGNMLRWRLLSRPGGESD